MKKLLLLFLCLTANIGFCQQAYYSDVTLTKTGIDLKDELAIKIISTHSNFLSYTPGVWEACKVTDLDPNDVTDSNVLLIYGYSDSDRNYITDRTRNKNDNGGDNGTDWNREHTYPKSLGNPNLGSSGPGSDAHHLRASDVQMNANRGSSKFASGNGNAGNSNGGWYPGDEWKGDAARIIMYMYLRYGDQCLPSNVTIGTTNSVDSNMIDLLLDWNAQDPVSTYEDNRNTYHENTLNTYAQGNRNPFIDNPNLATQIWGGNPAEDRWNTTPDTENPTAPTNLAASNSTNTTIDLNWTASTDNVAVSTYEIHVDAALYTTSTTNSITVTGLTKNTEYDFTVYAKDAAGNISTVSNTATVTTDNFIDSEAPSTITDLTASSTTSSSTTLNWTASTDNVGVTSYEIYQDGSLIDSSTTNSYSVSGLTPETNYNFTVYAKDEAGNASLVSNTEMITTLEALTGASELFISEYVEGGGYNKAIEIANYTGTNIDLSIYSLARQPSGSGSWEPDPLYQLSGTLATGNVFVIINSQAADSKLHSEKDDEVNNTAPMTFNGNDPVGLFKNGILIDIVGSYNGGSADFAKDITLRRKPSVIIPRTDYTISEWDSFGKDETSGIGSHSNVLSTPDFDKNLFSIYPNPAKNNKVTISLNNDYEINTIQLFSITGQLIKSINKPSLKNNTVLIDHIPRGIFFLKVESDNAVNTKRLIVE